MVRLVPWEGLWQFTLLYTPDSLEVIFRKEETVKYIGLGKNISKYVGLVK